MSTRTGTRKRAVRLTPEAMEVLQRALVERWQESGGAGKLTRERKAELLGLSVVTTDRLLKGEGVDRPSLTLAFFSLGLKWDESYCLLESAPKVSDPVALPTPSPSQTIPKQSQSRIGLLVVGVFVMFGLMMGASYRARTTDWIAEFDQNLALSEKHYHRADFKTARELAKSAMALAQGHENVSRLSEAMRLAGDIERATGDITEAHRYYFDAFRMRRSLPSTRNLASLLTYLGETETELGLHQDAAGHLQEARRRFEEAADVGGIVMVQRALGELAYAQGNYPAARQHYDLGLASVQDEAMRIDLLSLRALVQARERDFKSAREQLDKSFTFWSLRNHIRWIATTKLRRAEVELLAGDRELAGRLIEECRSYYAQIGDQGGVRACKKLEVKSKTGVAPAGSNVHSQ